MSCLFRSRKHSCFTLSVIILVLFSFAFISCGNLFNPESQESSASGNGGVNSSNIVTFRGTVSNSGAVPSGIAATSSLSGSTLQSDNLLSSAMPVFNTTDYEYFARAVEIDSSGEPVTNGQTSTGTFSDTSVPVFEIKLAPGIRWNITCGIRKKSASADAPFNQNDVYLEDSFDNDGNPLTASSPVITHTFYPKPVEGGKGSIALPMTLADSVYSVKVLCPDSNFPSLDRDRSSPYTLELSDITSGSYEVTFIFLDGLAPSDSSEPDTRTFLYSTTQTINVIKGMVTNTWRSDGTSLFTTSGGSTTFNLTDDIIKGFLDTTIYVGQNSAATSVNVTASDINSGHAFNPLAHLQAAVDKIAAAGDSTKEYKIFVSGTVTGTTELTSALGTTNANKKAKSITLCGLTGISGGVPQDVLDGNSSTVSVLKIATSVPVIIKNLRITGGNSSGNGGGINMISGSTVTLESGALIGGTNESDPTSGSAPANSETASANYAAKGGGIYSEGNLTLKNGSAVIYNYGTDGGGICCNGGSLTIKAGAKVNLNGTNTTGGGISITGSEFSMTGGELCNNISNSGAGGLYITKDSSNNCPALITINGATISGNSADSGGSAGGIFYAGGQTLSISGNTVISGNHCKFEGGGIRVAPGVLDLSDCTISGNYSNNGTRPGGGIAANAGGSIKLRGSVYIPAGATIGETFRTGNGCNDVRQNYGSIKIKGALTPPSNCTDGVIASITPNNAVRGTVLFEAEGSITDLTPYKDCFALTNAADGWELKLSDDKKKLVLDSPIYVAGDESTRQVCTANGSASGDGTKSHPFDTIANAVSAIAELSGASSTDYTILIDGELKATIDTTGYAVAQVINSSVQIQSITIKGVNGLDSNGDPIDVINGQADATHRARGITFDTDKVPVTIECLKITNGLADHGGGIYLSGGAELTLGDDVLVTGNEAKADGSNPVGGGIYFGLSTTLKVKGNARVIGNTISGTQTPSNVYLPAGHRIQVVGTLTNSTDSTKKANIGVSTATDPTLDTPVVFTSGYGYATGGYNAGVRPGTYFHGDKWGVKLGLAGAAGSGSPYEAALAASGGNITIEPVYEDIQISADKTSFAKDTASKVITFTAKGVNSEGQQVTLPIGTGEGKVSLTYSVSYHGETIPEESGSTSYYTTGTDTLTLGDALPLGEYTVSLTAIYNGKTYSASFEIAIGKYAALPSSYSDIESGKTYAVADSSAMEKLAEFSSYGYDFSGVTLKLSSDVTIDTTWTPVGNATAFRGTFDGDEKTVTFAAESNAEAFFGTVEGTVRNLKVAGSTSVAGIAKTANSSAVIENCESSATVTSSTTQDYCAGIVAAVLGNVTITGCVNTGAITSNVVLPADNYSYGAGGITGNVYNGGIIDSCKNTGNVTGPNAGGITGQVDSNSTIRNACNSGNITSTGLHAGGISAISQGNGGEINQASHIDNCFNSGSVTAEGTENVVYAGGIVGKHGWGNASWAQNCLNLGNVSISGSAKPGSHAGALFGLKDGWSRIDFCYYKEGCAGSNFGIGDSSDDTENECIKATQSGTNNAVITAGVTLNGTAYSADTSTVLSLLNAWVRANNTDGAYCEWETENHWPKLKIE